MIESKKQFQKDDMHYAAMICGNKMSELREIEDRKKRQRQLFQAGVPGVLNPDIDRSGEPRSVEEFLARIQGTMNHKEMDHKEMDKAVLSLITAKPTRPTIIDGITREQELNYFGVLAEDEERCGYCNKVKKKGDWCGNYRCSSNRKRRGEK